MGTSSGETSVQRVADAARTLYAVPLGEFVASRKAVGAAAKAEGDVAAAAEILALRKPTLTAWAINLTTRVEPGVVADLIGLGARMRAAQAQLDAGALSGARGERDAALAAYVDAVVATAGDAGARLSASAQEDVRASGIAALADSEASQALASGQLTRALSYSGFGEVDLSGAVAVTTSGAIMSVLVGGQRAPGASSVPSAEAPSAQESARDRERLRRRRRAQVAVDDAEAVMAGAQGDLAAAEEAARAARRAVVRAQAALDAAREQLRALS